MVDDFKEWFKNWWVFPVAVILLGGAYIIDQTPQEDPAASEPPPSAPTRDRTPVSIAPVESSPTPDSPDDTPIPSNPSATEVLIDLSEIIPVSGVKVTGNCSKSFRNPNAIDHTHHCQSWVNSTYVNAIEFTSTEQAQQHEAEATGGYVDRWYHCRYSLQWKTTRSNQTVNAETRQEAQDRVESYPCTG